MGYFISQCAKAAVASTARAFESIANSGDSALANCSFAKRLQNTMLSKYQSVRAMTQIGETRLASTVWESVLCIFKNFALFTFIPVNTVRWNVYHNPLSDRK